MDRVERDIAECMEEIDGKTERLQVLEQIVDRITEISKYRSKALEMHDMEEYYIEEINRWMGITETKTSEMNKREEAAREQDRKYLALLKKTRELELQKDNAQKKYEYYKHIAAKQNEVVGDSDITNTNTRDAKDEGV